MSLYLSSYKIGAKRLAIAIVDSESGRAVCSLPPALNNGRMPALRELRAIVEGRAIKPA